MRGKDEGGWIGIFFGNVEWIIFIQWFIHTKNVEVVRSILDPFAFTGTTVLFVTRVVMSSGGRVGLFTCNVTTGTSLFDFTSLMIILFLGVRLMCVIVGGGLFGFLLGGEGGYSLTTWVMDLAHGVHCNLRPLREIRLCCHVWMNFHK